MRVAALAVALLCMAGMAVAACECNCSDGACKNPPAQVQPLTGVFITFDDKTPIDLEKLHRVGIRMLIVQSVTFDEERTKQLIERAHDANKGFEVYLGLAFSDCFSAISSDLRAALREDKKVITTIKGWNVLGKIAGWYIGREIHNFNVDDPGTKNVNETHVRADEVKKYLKDVIAALPENAPPEKKKVLVSPNFNPTKRADLLDADGTKDLFRRIFGDSGVTTVLLQDGLGARNEEERIGCCTWSRAAFEEEAKAFSAAVRDAVGASRFGVNAESFEYRRCKEHHAHSSCFLRQLSLIPEDVPHRVTFQYRNLVSPKLWPAYVAAIPKPEPAK